MIDTQTTLHSHSLIELPEIYTKDDIEKVEYALTHPKNIRKDIVGTWTIARNILLFKLSYALATRPQELLCVKKEDLNTKTMMIRIPPEGNKLRRARTLPIPPQIFPYLNRYLMLLQMQYWNMSPYLFPSLWRNRLSTDRWQEALRIARIEAGIYRPRKKSAYALRHTKATELYMKTKDIKKVADVLGHKDFESAKVYVHLAHIASGYMEELRKDLSN